MKTARLHSCTVLQLGAEGRQLWQFGLNNGTPTLNAEASGLPSDPLPTKWSAKDWRSLWQTKVNIAWLPASQVFLRVVHLPASERAELAAMIELQLEKLSPLPVAQIVWSYELLPQSAEGLQTVLVVIVPRNRVEDFLGQLEGQGYLADRLEVPLLHQLLAASTGEDGVWVYPTHQNSEGLCLVAWWSGGSLRHLNLAHLSGTQDWAAAFTEQLTQTAWAGEIEGWLAAKPRCWLVADAAAAASWEPVLTEWAGAAVQVVPALRPAELAALSAERLAQAALPANLQPNEYAVRYRQQFIDRLWMGGLGAVVAVYLAGVLVYFAALQVLNFQKYRVDSKIAALSKTYTNAKQLTERVQVLQEQVDLRYTALDCWKAACERLPAELTLTSLSLQQGKVLMLSGTVPTDQVGELYGFVRALGDYHPKGPDAPALFSHVNTPTTRAGGPGAGQNTSTWDFTCELQGTEAP